MTGVWRRKTIVTVGGWKSRTTVEDMDLSLRTYVNGWKAVYLSDTTCMNEVSTLPLFTKSPNISQTIFTRSCGHGRVHGRIRFLWRTVIPRACNLHGCTPVPFACYECPLSLGQSPFDLSPGERVFAMVWRPSCTRKQWHSHCQNWLTQQSGHCWRVPH